MCINCTQYKACYGDSLHVRVAMENGLLWSLCAVPVAMVPSHRLNSHGDNA